jgi:hypothetical protein
MSAQPYPDGGTASRPFRYLPRHEHEAIGDDGVRVGGMRRRVAGDIDVVDCAGFYLRPSCSASFAVKWIEAFFGFG